MWKIVKKKALFRKKGEPSNNNAVSSNAKVQGFERKGAVGLGPFSLDEFGQLRDLFA